MLVQSLPPWSGCWCCRSRCAVAVLAIFARTQWAPSLLIGRNSSNAARIAQALAAVAIIVIGAYAIAALLR
jgi:hypothetical protein